MLRSVPAVAALLAAPAVASAQAAGSIEVGGYGQVTGVDPEQARFETRTPLGLGIRGRVNLHAGIGVELEASTGMVDGAGDPQRRRYNQLVARGTYTHPISDFSGLLLGAGIARSDYEVTYNFGPSLLVGVRTVIRGRYALRSDAIFNYLPTSGAREFGLRTGVQAVLGPFEGATARDRQRGNRAMQEPGSIEGGVFGQQWRLAEAWNLRSGQAVGSRVGAFLTSRSAVEVEATYGRQRVREGGRAGQTGVPLPAGATYRVTTFAFRYDHNLPVGRRMAAVAGIGPLRSSVEYIDYWGGSALAGLRLAMTRDVHLRADGVVHYLPSAKVVETAVRIGTSVVVRLGR
ncbi:MAG: hypothetical protein IT355_09665 [Gemmatimonadaceae bacterium]|nr:hypothetical protein [Gemmatimonadaceae bacterium]